MNLTGYRGICKGNHYGVQAICHTPATFQPPSFIDNRGYCTPTENQMDKPWCVAYSAAQYVEAKTWQREHSYKQIDPAPIYAECKRIDGDNDDGTYLSSAFQALKNLNYIPSTANMEILKTLRDVQYALHSNQVCFLCFRINDTWYSPDASTGWISDSRGNLLGGHCVLGCWYQLGKGVGFQNSWGKWGCDGFGRIGEAAFNNEFMEGMIIV